MVSHWKEVRLVNYALEVICEGYSKRHFRTQSKPYPTVLILSAMHDRRFLCIIQSAAKLDSDNHVFHVTFFFCASTLLHHACPTRHGHKDALIRPKTTFLTCAYMPSIILGTPSRHGCSEIGELNSSDKSCR